MPSTLEKQFAREEKQRKRSNEKWAENERKRKKREDATRARKDGAVLRELLSVFRKKQPVKISGGSAEFTFNGREYDVRYGKWTIGGNSSDVDDYVTNHEGWCLYSGSRITDIFEVEKYSTPPRLKPTPEQFSKALVEILHHIQRDPRYFGL
jgi:hypothetical protein